VNAAIEASDLNKRYGAVRALDRVSFAVAPSTVTLIVGPNGAGKSTLLRVVACLTRPTSGTVRILGKDPFGRDGAALRGQIGWIGAQAGLYEDLTVEENLHFAVRLHGTDPARVDSVLQDLGLPAVRHRRVRTLSTGYRRRTGLARALLPGPALLLLDEPWNGLDAEASERLTEVLGRHRDRGGTVVVAAHGAPAARELADGVLHIERGILRRESGSSIEENRG
jgi:heme ABC exporter ATP-binding subunit CcmA